MSRQRRDEVAPRGQRRRADVGVVVQEMSRADRGVHESLGAEAQLDERHCAGRHHRVEDHVDAREVVEQRAVVEQGDHWSDVVVEDAVETHALRSQLAHHAPQRLLPVLSHRESRVAAAHRVGEELMPESAACAASEVEGKVERGGWNNGGGTKEEGQEEEAAAAADEAILWHAVQPPVNLSCSHKIRFGLPGRIFPFF